MSDPITILSTSAQQNVASQLHGVTPLPAGLAGGVVPLSAQRKGSIVDVTDYSSLRLYLELTAMSSRRGDEQGTVGAATLYVALEHRSAPSSPWEILHRFEPMQQRGRQHVVTSAFYPEVRASWYWIRHYQPSSTYTDEVAMTFGVVGEAIPEAAA